MYVCLCKGITESDVRRAATCGNVSSEDLVETFDLCAKDCCGRCARNINRMVAIAESHLTEQDQVRLGSSR